MALPMDSLIPVSGAVPELAPLSMPTQSFEARVPGRALARTATTRIARGICISGTLALTAYAGHEMWRIVSPARVTGLQWALVALFTVTFAWIALAASSALAGVLLGGRMRRPFRPDAQSSGGPSGSRTALIMPVYNEDPARTCAALRAIALGLDERGAAAGFEIFVLSDSNDSELFLRETAAMSYLREALATTMPVWYRHRRQNSGRKAGNVRDFVERWGARYDYMVVLDADSLMSGSTILELVRDLDEDPRCALVQTVPRLHRADTFFGRLQQFASAIYGPVVARGVACWQGSDGNYWGHNAILRVDAFAASAGLPVLAGRKPFGGDILSHDFVEAALLRRAGWGVRMRPDLGGSWEESPPTLHEVSVRDRRWAQGNLQHLGLLRSKGLAAASRAHFLIGVMSYAASPLWLCLVTIGLLLTVQVATTEPRYFGSEPTLFPHWPVFDSRRMVRLFELTLVVLMIPKLIGILRALLVPSLRRGVGALRLVAGAVVETIFSALYAPIFMLTQSRQLIEILLGRDSGWRPQQRTQQREGWRCLFVRYAWHMSLGWSVAVGVQAISPRMVVWIAPTLLGAMLAVPLARLAASRRLARVCRFVGLLAVSDERVPSREVLEQDRMRVLVDVELSELSWNALLHNEKFRARHVDWLADPPKPERALPDTLRATAELKIREAANAGEALEWMSEAEKIAVLDDARLLESLARAGAETA